MTSAQNGGRMQMLNEAKDMGINVKKQWLATSDGRTRDSHRHLDGQIRDVDKPFKSDFGRIDYPGDPKAHPADVYNCRCTLVYVYPEYDDMSQYPDSDANLMNFEEWERMKKEYSKYDDEGIPHQGKIDGVVDNIEFGEMFDPKAVQITHDTIAKLQKEYPLDTDLEFVGDVRLYRGYDLDMDVFDLRDYEGVDFDAHYVQRTKDRKPSIEIANEMLNMGSLEDEFEIRHELRVKYGGWLTEKTAFGVASDTLEGTIDHEYAHGLQDMFHLFSGSRDDREMEFCSWLYQYNSENKENARQISNYAAQHPFEMLSESFVQIHDTKHQDTIAYKTAKEVWDEFDDFMNYRGRWKR